MNGETFNGEARADRMGEATETAMRAEPARGAARRGFGAALGRLALNKAARSKTALNKAVLGAGAAAASGLVSAAAWAQEATQGAGADDPGYRIGRSEPGQLDLQEPATQVARQITDLHHLMLWIITAICIFVLVLLAIVIVRYNKAANPKAQTWTHNTALEIAWTVIPVIILVIIAIPSVRLLQLQEDFDRVEPDLVVQVSGLRYGWEYKYVSPEGGLPDAEFVSIMLGNGAATMNDQVRDELARYGYPESTWLYAVDNAMVVPVDATVLVQVTASDVIHSWTIPSFGVKADGVPGKTNQLHFRAEEIGFYFGQCSELCGPGHSFMPITVKVVSQEDYDAWISCARANDGITDDCPSPTMIEPRQPEQTASAVAE